MQIVSPLHFLRTYENNIVIKLGVHGNDEIEVRTSLEADGWRREKKSYNDYFKAYWDKALNKITCHRLLTPFDEIMAAPPMPFDMAEAHQGFVVPSRGLLVQKPIEVNATAEWDVDFDWDDFIRLHMVGNGIQRLVDGPYRYARSRNVPEYSGMVMLLFEQIDIKNLLNQPPTY